MNFGKNLKPKLTSSVNKIFSSAKPAVDFLYKYFCKVTCACYESVGEFYKKFVRYSAKALRLLSGIIGKYIVKTGRGIYIGSVRIIRTLKEPYYVIKSYCEVLSRKVNHAKEKDKSTVKAFFRTLGEGIKRNRRLMITTAFNYIMPVAGVIVLVMAVNYVSALTFAVEVSYNGTPIGTVSEESVVTEAKNMLTQRIIDESGNQNIKTDTTLTVKLADKESILNEDTLVDRMIKNSSDDITEAAGVYINGKLVGAAPEAEPLNTALKNILASHKTKYSKSLSFADDIKIRTGLYLTSSVSTTEELIDLLSSNRTEQKKYTIKSGDAPISVAEKFGLTLREFYNLNPGARKSFIEGDKVVVTARVPYLSVKETRRITYTTTINYKTEYVDDSSTLKGTTTELRAGKNGKKKVVADAEYINGVEVDRKIISSKVTKQVVNRKVARGTKVVTAGPDSASAGSSQFIWPVGGGYTSSHFGYRGSEYHKGTDIAAPAGTAVYASAPGTVKLASWYSGYGYCVIIDHGNGIETLYGHNSALHVSYGQTVRQGQQIASVGQTGWATGNHCHFEIRVGGSIINPENYIGTR